MRDQRKAGLADYFAYAAAALINILPSYLLSSFLSAYYTDVALISAGAVGSVILAMRFTDGISDLIMGRVIDRTNTRFGKARPWVLAGSIGVTFTLFSIFHVPAGFSSGLKVAWLAVAYFLLMTVFSTMEGVSMSTMLVYLTNDTQERNKFGAFNMAGTYIGGILATTVTSVLLTVFGYVQSGYDKTILLYSAIIFVLGVFAFVKLKETNNGLGEHSDRQQERKASIREVLYAMGHNRFYINAVIAGLMINLINGITTGLGVYFCRDIFGNAALYTFVTIAVLFPTLFGIPVGVAMAKRLGHHKTLVYGRIGYMFCMLVTAVGIMTTSIPIYFAGTIGGGLCGATFAACFQARVANICDYGEWRYKTNATGVLMSATSFCNKVGLGLGAAGTGLILVLAKYDGTLAAQGIAQSTYTVSVERFAMALVPLLLNLIVTICLYFSNVDPYMDTVNRELEERRKQGEGA